MAHFRQYGRAQLDRLRHQALRSGCLRLTEPMSKLSCEMSVVAKTAGVGNCSEAGLFAAMLEKGADFDPREILSVALELKDILLGLDSFPVAIERTHDNSHRRQLGFQGERRHAVFRGQNGIMVHDKASRQVPSEAKKPIASGA
jgi:hypothetical protein